MDNPPPPAVTDSAPHRRRSESTVSSQMRTQRTATIASRALGLAFLVISLTSASYRIPEMQAAPRSTQSALPAEPPAQTDRKPSWMHLLPCFLELGASVVFLTLSRPIGRFLARGLAD